MRHWFTLFDKTLEKFCIFQGNTYNMDKKSYVLGLGGKAKVLIPSDEKSRSICQPGNQESVTIIECINADGVAIPPFVIWAAKTHQMRGIQQVYQQTINLQQARTDIPILNLAINGCLSVFI